MCLMYSNYLAVLLSIEELISKSTITATSGSLAEDPPTTGKLPPSFFLKNT